MIPKEEFLSIAASKYAELSKLEGEKNFYDYEKKYEQIMAELSRIVLESMISKVPADRRKKNFNPIWGDRNSEQLYF